MDLPNIQIIMTLFLAHVFILGILLFCWLFIRHAQKKHKEIMTPRRVVDLPESEHHINDQILSMPMREPSINLPERPKRVPKKTPKRKTKSYEKEWAQVEEELKVLRGTVAPDFNHNGPKLNKPSKEDVITVEQTRLDEVIQDSKSEHQEEFEKNWDWIRKAIKRKGYKDPGLRSYEEQLNSIDETLKQLDLPDEDNSKITEGATSSNLPLKNSNSECPFKSHQTWKEKIVSDLENLFKISSSSAKKHLSLKKNEPFVTTLEKEEAEKKAVELVREISRRIEGDHPIPVSEMEWIEASLYDVHKDIWQKDKEPSER